MRLIALALLIFLNLALAGCATNYGASKIDDHGTYLQLDKGVTTKKDVYALFGQPHNVKYLDSGESLWVYYRVRMTMSGATFVPFINLVAGGSNADYTVGSFYFDNHDFFSKVETVSRSQYVNQWVGMGTVAVKNDELVRVRDEMQKLNLAFDEKLARQMKGTYELFGD